MLETSMNENNSENSHEQRSTITEMTIAHARHDYIHSH